ncbi:MAG: helix-turn-helix domain-containing protein [Candidatus Azobacteroides sp.]|nr:helix-turn-helix domain-containing protein [Candidatus Azobacteroides sp.]
MDDFNEIFRLAAELINNTSCSLFLTGKAGTGKTTFLRHIKAHTPKNVIVAAPTGVAAINAGGTTIHSLFQLPFEPFLPDLNGMGARKLSHHFRMHKSKIDMFRELELLIIDEVSMLRADVLDAIDTSLRHFRRNRLPFGGVQMLYIGDMYQLPPVAQNEEWELLKEYYKTPFFFHAKAVEESPPLYIELKKIYRQNEQAFIDILNQVRNNEATKATLEKLNERYNPDFTIPENENYIVLSTHNYKTEVINNSELEKLPGKPKKYLGEMKGSFSDSSLPTEKELCLKKGAQVMFVKNDTCEPRRYYNGKLGTIIDMDDEKVCVQLTDSNIRIELEKETWRNVRYTLNKESNEIEEEELGAFTQFPIRLAWAVTIHKSQGLTFERAVIDAGQAFAAGQVYVALSRCTSLEGIVLQSRITPASIKTDPHVVEFSKIEKSPEELKKILAGERPRFLRQRLVNTFEWRYLLNLCTSFAALVEEKKLPDSEAALSLAMQMKTKAYQQQEIAGKFQTQLQGILNRYEQENDISELKDRIKKAVTYFDKDICEYMLYPLTEHLDNLKRASKVKQYVRAAREIREGIKSFLLRLRNLSYGDFLLTEGINFTEIDSVEQEEVHQKTEKKRPEKGTSGKLTLTMFREGKSIEDICLERNLAQSTIEGHLSGYIRTGDISVYALVPEEKVKTIEKAIDISGEKASMSEIKQKLGDEFSYAELRAVLNHRSYLNSLEKE